jgi:hypothetical protein
MALMFDLSKNCNFKIILPTTQKFIELFSVETSIPGITIGSIDLPYSSMVRKMPGDSLTYDELTLTILIDKELNTYKELISILNLTHNPITNTYDVDQEVFDAFLLITSNKNNPLFQLHFYSMWIETFSAISLTSTSGDDNPYNCTLGLKYNYYVLEDI